eukprot:1887473-Rhodomonas_salina.1
MSPAYPGYPVPARTEAHVGVYQLYRRARSKGANPCTSGTRVPATVRESPRRSRLVHTKSRGGKKLSKAIPGEPSGLLLLVVQVLRTCGISTDSVPGHWQALVVSTDAASDNTVAVVLVVVHFRQDCTAVVPVAVLLRYRTTPSRLLTCDRQYPGTRKHGTVRPGYPGTRRVTVTTTAVTQVTVTSSGLQWRY